MTEEQFKTYFNANFAGVQNLIDTVLTPMFGTFNSKTLTDRTVDVGNGNANIDHIYEYGWYTVVGQVSVWEVVLSDNCRISQARKNIQNVVRQLLGTYSGAFVVFHYADGSTNADAATWRLSWIKKEATQAGATSAKRYTYLCGPSYPCRTIAERFCVLQNTPSKTLDSITAAFDVEALSDEFFYNYRALYSKIQGDGERDKSRYRRYKKLSDIPESELGFCDFIEKHKNDTQYFASDFASWDSKVLRDYIKKLMGRLVFLQFLQKKGWMCGNPNYIKSLFEKFVEENNETVSDTTPGSFLDEVLEPLFFGVLNTKAKDRKALFEKKQWNLGLLNEWKDIPYLNGGLFEQEVYDKPKSAFPNVLFNELFTLFSEYNFTIDENDPDDKEVGIDPEMLSKIFESQLEDNKDKGAFYTPKEIVEYMCKESLIAYLQTDIKDESQKENIRSFVCDREAALQDELKCSVAEKLKNVKICDPAIGSGAFPMGMLNLLVTAREKIEGELNRLELKKEIICNNLYGVDIEKGAVDIARLRFWLSLVIDEDEPAALPNLDYKIMQGNSLLEQYEGVDLSGMSLNEQAKSKAKKGQSWQQTLVFDEQGALDNIQNAIRESFATEDHNRKSELREIINENIKNYICNLKGCTPEIQQKLAELPIPNDKFFLWHIYFKEVFDNGGFDIVIGNPPYVAIRSGAIDEPIKKLYKKQFYSAKGQFDLYALFIEHGINILKHQGVLTMITESTFVNNKDFKNLREVIIARNTLVNLSYLGENVFDTARVDVSILIERREFNECNNVNLCQSYEDFKKRVFIQIPQSVYNNKNANYEIKVRSNISELLLFEKIKRGNILLGKISEMPRGAEFGANADFIESIPLEGYYKLIVGRDIKKYFINFSQRFAPYDNNNISVFKDIEYYTNPKILIQRIRNLTLIDRIVATYDDESYMCTNTLRMLVIKKEYQYNLKFILGLLNSRVVNHVFRTLFLNKDIYKYQLEQIPVPDGDQLPIITLVNRILSAKKANPKADTFFEETLIDILVYLLYNLTFEEVQIVDKAFSIKETEYSLWLANYQNNGTLPTEAEMRKALGK